CKDSSNLEATSKPRSHRLCKSSRSLGRKDFNFVAAKSCTSSIQGLRTFQVPFNNVACARYRDGSGGSPCGTGSRYNPRLLASAESLPRNSSACRCKLESCTETKSTSLVDSGN